jgi:hypothetical protein
VAEQVEAHVLKYFHFLQWFEETFVQLQAEEVAVL